MRALVCSLLVGISFLGVDAAPAPAPVPAPAGLDALRFLPNLGQWDPAVRFAVLGGSCRAWVHDDGFSVRLERWDPAPDGAAGSRGCEGAVVRTRFLGGNAAVVADGAAVAGLHHFHVGEPSRWRRDVPAFERVRLQRLHAGVDLVLRAGDRADAALQYDLHLQPAADLAAIVAECDGVRSLRVDAAGALVLAVPLFDGSEVELVQPPPVSWQLGPDGPQAVSVRFERRGERRFGFVADGLDPTLPTVVDPGVVWSTLLGGGGSDSVNDLRWRPGTGLWVAGWAGSADFPTTPGVYRTTGIRDGFVARLSESGQALVFATYLGGAAGDEVRGLDLNGANEVFVGGVTVSPDFPTTAGAWQRTYGGASPVLAIGDGFVARLSANGSALLASTFVGGALDDVIEGLDVDGSNVFVAGWTFSPDFRTTPGAFMAAMVGPPGLQTDGFVVRLDAALATPGYSTLMGSLFSDQLLDIAVDGGLATVCGWSQSSTYPTTTNAYRTTSAGETDGVVTRLNATGSALQWSTFLGGASHDHVLSVELASDGSVLLGGMTRSTNFPTSAGAFQRVLAGLQDGFAAVLGSNGQSLSSSSLLGGPGVDVVRAVTRTTANQLFAVGETAGGFPVTPGAPQELYGGGSRDAFASLFAASGATLDWSTYFGGLNQEVLDTAVVGTGGLAVVGGWTWSPDYPTTNGALQTALRGIEDGVVMQLDLATSLEGFLGSEVLPGPLAATFVPGDVPELLAVRVTNHTPRPLTLRGMRVFLGGSGDAVTASTGLSVWRDDPATPTARDQLLVAGLPVLSDHGETVVPLTALPALLPAESVDLRLGLATRTQVASGAEFAAAVIDSAAWDVVPVGSALRVDVRGGRLAGPTVSARAFPSFPADVDGDAALTVSDLRGLCMRLGQSSTTLDPDGNGVLEPGDVDLTRDVILGRTVIASCPEPFVRGAWVALPGWYPTRELTVAIGGRVLTIGTITPRELTVRIDPALAVGQQSLTLSMASRQLGERTVAVQ